MNEKLQLLCPFDRAAFFSKLVRKGNRLMD